MRSKQKRTEYIIVAAASIAISLGLFAVGKIMHGATLLLVAAIFLFYGLRSRGRD